MGFTQIYRDFEKSVLSAVRPGEMLLLLAILREGQHQWEKPIQVSKIRRPEDRNFWRSMRSLQDLGIMKFSVISDDLHATTGDEVMVEMVEPERYAALGRHIREVRPKRGRPLGSKNKPRQRALELEFDAPAPANETEVESSVQCEPDPASKDAPMTFSRDEDVPAVSEVFALEESLLQGDALDEQILFCDFPMDPVAKTNEALLEDTQMSSMQPEQQPPPVQISDVEALADFAVGMLKILGGANLTKEAAYKHVGKLLDVAPLSVCQSYLGKMLPLLLADKSVNFPLAVACSPERSRGILQDLSSQQEQGRRQRVHQEKLQESPKKLSPAPQRVELGNDVELELESHSDRDPSDVAAEQSAEQDLDLLVEAARKIVPEVYETKARELLRPLLAYGSVGAAVRYINETLPILKKEASIRFPLVVACQPHRAQGEIISLDTRRKVRETNRVVQMHQGGAQGSRQQSSPSGLGSLLSNLVGALPSSVNDAAQPSTPSAPAAPAPTVIVGTTSSTLVCPPEQAAINASAVASWRSSLKGPGALPFLPKTAFDEMDGAEAETPVNGKERVHRGWLYRFSATKDMWQQLRRA